MDASFPILVGPVLYANNAPSLAEFLRAFLGLGYRAGQDSGDDPHFIVIDCDDGTPSLAIQQVESLPRADWPGGPVPQQVHLDLAVSDIEEQRRQVARTLELGATVLQDRRHEGHDPLIVMADPAGHSFCLIAPPMTT